MLEHLRRRLRFHGEAAMSGGKGGLALAGAVSAIVGGSVGALVAWLADVSWLLAALVALGCLFVFYMEGAYRVWARADRRARDAEDALEAEEAKPKVRVAGVNIEGGTGNMAWDNTTYIVPPPGRTEP